MSGEIPPSAPSPFSAMPVSRYELLMQLIEAHGGALPPDFAAAILGFMFAMPAVFPTFGARAFQPLPQIRDIQKNVERALLLLENETAPKGLVLNGSGALQAPKAPGNGQPMQKSETFPFFRLMAREFALFKKSFADLDKPSQADAKKGGAKDSPEPMLLKGERSTLKVAGLLEQARLASDFLQSKDLPERTNRFFSQISSFKENLENFILSLEKEFQHHEKNRGVVQELKLSLKHLEKALLLLQELKNPGREIPQERLAEIPRELQKALQDFMKDFRAPLERALEKGIDKKAQEFTRPSFSAPTPFEKPQAASLDLLRSLSQGESRGSSEKGLLGKVFHFLLSQEGVAQKPNVPQAINPPLSFVVPYSDSSRPDTKRLLRSKKKDEKDSKREEKALSYSSDEFFISEDE